MAVLEARAITHRYGDRVVLKEVNLSLPAGGRCAVVGPNGSGKTTLLRLLAKLEKPCQGEVTASRSGAPVTAELSFRRCVTLVLQRPFLFHTTVLGNVLYGLRARGMGRREAREKAIGALAQAGLASLQSRPARGLSVGEGQLVNLVRALVLDPEALLLDEVTAHLDPENQGRVEDLVLRFSREQGASIVFVTQNLPQAFRVADEGVMLYRGEVLQKGRLAGFLERPEDQRVADFVQGQMLKPAC